MTRLQMTGEGMHGRIINLFSSQLILMGLFTMLLARRKHRYGLLVSSSHKLPVQPRGSVIGADSSAIKSGFITFADESLRFRGSGVRVGVRPRHRHHHGDPYVPTAESPRVRLHRTRKVYINPPLSSLVYVRAFQEEKLQSRVTVKKSNDTESLRKHVPTIIIIIIIATCIGLTLVPLEMVFAHEPRLNKFSCEQFCSYYVEVISFPLFTWIKPSRVLISNSHVDRAHVTVHSPREIPVYCSRELPIARRCTARCRTACGPFSASRWPVYWPAYSHACWCINC